jgi:hypothetical protein
MAGAGGRARSRRARLVIQGQVGWGKPERRAVRRSSQPCHSTLHEPSRACWPRSPSFPRPSVRRPAASAAIDSAAPGDTVLVAPGRYVENIRFRGKGIVVASEYLRTRDPVSITRTIIDGSRPKHPDAASVVLMVDQEDTTAALVGFTITGGTGTVWTDARQKALSREGGGVLCELGSPVIEHNLIEGNEAVRVGPGILSAGGGGIRCGYAEPIIRHNVIRGNRGEYGAGIVLYHSAAIVSNNLIAGNIAVNADSTPTQLGGRGGGLTVYAPTVLRNNLVWGNRQAAGGPIDASTRRPPELHGKIVDDGRTDSPFADSVRYRPDVGVYGGPGAAELLP